MFGKRVSRVVPIISCLNGHFLFAVGFGGVLGTELRGLIRGFEISRLFCKKLLWSLMYGMGCSGAELVLLSKKNLRDHECHSSITACEPNS